MGMYCLYQVVDLRVDKAQEVIVQVDLSADRTKGVRSSCSISTAHTVVVVRACPSLYNPTQDLVINLVKPIHNPLTMG